MSATITISDADLDPAEISFDSVSDRYSFIEDLWHSLPPSKQAEFLTDKQDEATAEGLAHDYGSLHPDEKKNFRDITGLLEEEPEDFRWKALLQRLHAVAGKLTDLSKEVTEIATETPVSEIS